jgi:hypothetical protein
LRLVWSRILLKLSVLLFCPLAQYLYAEPKAVATFESIGIYWDDALGADASNECIVNYRILGANAWQTGLTLWYDDRGGNFGQAEYRGSLVNLNPNTNYEIKLTLKSGTSKTFTARTWNEEFPISKTIELPANSSNTLIIAESGTQDGYIIYTVPSSETATIDVGNESDYNITIAASYIIIRGLTLKGAKKHGIRLYSQAHDIVIEDMDISGWGRISADVWGANMDSAIFSDAIEVERLIVQRSKLHHPRSDSNNWDEYRAKADIYHPQGPQGITLIGTSGNHVIRYNEIYSDEDHYFNDCFGGGANFSFAGSPNRDSDIYGNHISHCWDDGIEVEGANRNVRIWGNYIDKTFVGIGSAATSIGPLYIWRNIYGVSLRSDQSDLNNTKRGGFLKTSNSVGFSGGKIFVFHNTILQPSYPNASEPVGSHTGLGWGGNMQNVMSRNNILQVHNSKKPSIRGQVGDNGDYNFDLFNGRIDGQTTSQPNGINDTPIYYSMPTSKVLASGIGIFTLDKSSPGYDSGMKISNFNDGFEGDAPDMGAHEANTSPMQFGVRAYKSIILENSLPSVNVRETKSAILSKELNY